MTQSHPIFQKHRLDQDIPMLLSAQHGSATDRSKEVHSHPEGQLYVSLQGVIVFEAGSNRSVLPPGRLGWIPPGMPHGVSVHGNQLRPGLAGYTLHLKPSLCHGMPEQARVLTFSPLAQALFNRMCSWPQGWPSDDAARRVMEVFLDEMRVAQADPLHLTMPRHPRLLTMAAAIAENPADDTDLDTWAERLALSRRSITRHFRSETGMSLVEWRQVARLQKGMEMLTAGVSVTTAAMELGYDSVSSFIALFRRVLGTTPARFAQFE